MTTMNRVSEALGFGKPDWLPHVTSALITMASVALVATLWRSVGALPNPEVLLLLTVAVATFIAGGVPGMLSAGIVLVSAFALYSEPVYSFRYSEMDWRQAMLVVVSAPLIALMVGSLKEQVDQLRIVTEENDQLRLELDRYQRMGNLLHICEERFRLAADNVKDHAIVVLDVNGIVKSWNPGAEAMMGYTAQEIVGQSYSRFFVKDDILARQPDRLLEIAEFSGRVEDEAWRLAKSGARFRANTSISALKSTAGPLAGFILVATDLTEREKLEEALGKAKVEIDELKKLRS